MINKHFDGIGNMQHAEMIAKKVLKSKKINTEIRISYFNGFAVFIKTSEEINEIYLKSNFLSRIKLIPI